MEIEGDLDTRPSEHVNQTREAESAMQLVSWSGVGIFLDADNLKIIERDKLVAQLADMGTKVEALVTDIELLASITHFVTTTY